MENGEKESENEEVVTVFQMNSVGENISSNSK
jgi:hypothetical protein